MNKSTKQLMAEYIIASDCTHCDVCVHIVECDEKFRIAEEKGEFFEPNDCINGIINFFEKKKIKNNGI